MFTLTSGMDLIHGLEALSDLVGSERVWLLTSPDIYSIVLTAICSVAIELWYRQTALQRVYVLRSQGDFNSGLSPVQQFKRSCMFVSRAGRLSAEPEIDVRRRKCDSLIYLSACLLVLRAT